MIRVDHLSLPAGLRAIAQRTGRGELYVVVSDALDPAAQRGAVRAAVRAARRHAWEFGFLPLPAAAALPALGTAVRHMFRVLRAHLGISALAGAVAAGAATAAIFAVAVPHPAGHPGASAPRSPGYTRPPGTGSAHSGTPRPRQSSGNAQRVITVGTPKANVPHPGPASQPAAPSAAPPAQSQPPPASSPQPTTPASSSSPPSPGGGGKTCVYLLGVLICI